MDYKFLYFRPDLTRYLRFFSWIPEMKKIKSLQNCVVQQSGVTNCNSNGMMDCKLTSRFKAVLCSRRSHIPSILANSAVKFIRKLKLCYQNAHKWGTPCIRQTRQTKHVLLSSLDCNQEGSKQQEAGQNLFQMCKEESRSPVLYTLRFLL